MTNIRLAVVAALLSAGLVALSAHGAAAQQFYAGECVTIGTYPAVIIGPVAGHPELWEAQDMRGGRPGNKAWWRVGQIQESPCPTAATAKAACFPSDPDSGRTQLETAVRGAIREEVESAIQPGTVKFQYVQVGQQRAWTSQDSIEYAQGDPQYGLTTANVGYTSCYEDSDYVRTVKRQDRLACYVSTNTGLLTCQSTSEIAPHEDQTVSKY